MKKRRSSKKSRPRRNPLGTVIRWIPVRGRPAWLAGDVKTARGFRLRLTRRTDRAKRYDRHPASFVVHRFNALAGARGRFHLRVLR